jgi:hypothetical protein
VRLRNNWECARECARLAAETKDREAKNHLLDMAQAWTELALLEAGVVSQRYAISQCALAKSAYPDPGASAWPVQVELTLASSQIRGRPNATNPHNSSLQ